MTMRRLGLRYVSQVQPLSVTTPIFYVNAKPHIGHAYSMVLADAICRWQRVRDRTTPAGHLFTGTDEHGEKVCQAAQANGQTPHAWAETMSTGFRELARELGCSVRRFLRTTEPAHHRVVQHLWRQLAAGGDIYLGVHAGWYCVSDETFYPEHETRLADDGGRISTSRKPLRWVEEPNYLFRLSRYREPVLRWLRTTPSPVVPSERANDLWTYLENDSASFRDLSVSRRRGPHSWGIPVPDDPTQCIYVWLDALANYLTVMAYPERRETPDIHVLGKDILKFHAVYWPAFLMAASLPLPRQLLVHGHWTAGQTKISKSVGNSVDPMGLLQSYGQADVLRYYLLRESRPASDTDFSPTSLSSTVNGELVNQLGNLLSRAFTGRFLSAANASQQTPPVSPALARQVQETCQRCAQAYEEHNFGAGLEHLLQILRLANARFSEAAPWRDTPAASEGLTQLLADVGHCCLVYSVMAYPAIPTLAGSVWKLLSPRAPTHAMPPFTFGDIIEGKVPSLDLSAMKIQGIQPILPRL